MLPIEAFIPVVLGWYMAFGSYTEFTNGVTWSPEVISSLFQVGNGDRVHSNNIRSFSHFWQLQSLKMQKSIFKDDPYAVRRNREATKKASRVGNI